MRIAAAAAAAYRKLNPKQRGQRGHLSVKGSCRGIECDSSWEAAVVVYFKDHNKRIERNTLGFEYEYQGRIRRYYPDFYLGDRTYLEVKGLTTDKDYVKWEAFRKSNRLIIINRNAFLKFVAPYIKAKYANLSEFKNINYSALFDTIKFQTKKLARFKDKTKCCAILGVSYEDYKIIKSAYCSDGSRLKLGMEEFKRNILFLKNTMFVKRSVLAECLNRGFPRNRANTLAKRIFGLESLKQLASMNPCDRTILKTATFHGIAIRDFNRLMKHPLLNGHMP